jgi:flagellar basal-body rod modification protein FlgD
MATINTNTLDTTTLTTDTTTATNPDSILGKDDFMQLLLVELQHQDPTDPMDSDKILSQTSQLAAIETQEKTNKALEELTASFKQNKNFAAVDTIGKYARLENKVDLKKDTEGNPVPLNFTLNFNEDIKEGQIEIYDEKNRLVKVMELSEDTKGEHSFTWDGLTDAGENAKPGKYSIYANYYNPDGVKLSGEFGSYKIESVKFEEENTYLKLNGAFVPFDKIQEIYEGES